MIYSLPKLGKEALALPHFPTKHQAFIFRAYEYIPTEKIAALLKTSPENVRIAAEEMGLPPANVSDIWLRRGYITVIRRMWHILPYEQLLELLEMDSDTLATIMREEDFLDIKLSDKPICEPVFWRELTDEERIATKKIRKIIEKLSFGGKGAFEFEYSVPHVTFSGEERFATRMIYAFSGLYQHAFDVDSEEFLPNEQLEAYRALGINGIWTQGVLSQLAEFPFDTRVSAGYESRIERMKALTERLDKYGIKLYLYINEPRAMPLSFFEGRENIKGHALEDKACLCISTPEVRKYVTDAIESVCRCVPKLGGFFTITRSENVTNCYSHSEGEWGVPCNCPRCKERSIGEVIGDTLSAFLEGARRVSEDIKVFAWSWRWDEFNEEIIRRIPKGVIMMSQSELGVPFEIGGISGNVLDYSMSILGPGERARREWQLAKECGLECAAKVQINTTWEASTVPALPVSPSVEEHIKALGDEGVSHLLLSWTLGGYPSLNIAAAAKYFFDGCTTEISEQSADTVMAEKQFSRAFAEFPFHIRCLYLGPQNPGPSNFLYPTPTGYKATMTCFSYDDLDAWRSIYPREVYEKQFEKLSSEWQKGLDMLEGTDSECAIMARAAYCLFKSSHNQIRFIRARDEGRYADAISAARDELEITEMMLNLMNKNAAIGYEAANHYYFSKGQLAEKILNCHYAIDFFLEKSEK